MEPRELDALVAEKVMGWSAQVVEVMRYRNSRLVDPQPTGRQRLWVTRPDGARYICPEYSTDMSAAWRVVEKMLEGDSAEDFGYELLEMANAGKCTTYADMVCAVLDTMTPENICKAALRALGIPIEGGE